jgi:hypothetical protein
LGEKGYRGMWLSDNSAEIRSSSLIEREDNMKPIGYNFRQAKDLRSRRMGNIGALDLVLKTVKSTPGAWKRILEQQKQAYLKKDDNLMR